MNHVSFFMNTIPSVYDTTILNTRTTYSAWCMYQHGMSSLWVCVKLLSKECSVVTQQGYLKTTEL